MRMKSTMVTRFFYSIVIILLASVSVNAENQMHHVSHKIDQKVTTETFDAEYFIAKGFTPSYQTAGIYSQFAQCTFFYFGQNTQDHNNNNSRSGTFLIIPSDSATSLKTFLCAAMEEFQKRNTKVTVIVSGGDVSNLPLFYKKNSPSGLKYCADLIEPVNSQVFIITDSLKSDIIIDAGTNIAPYTMLQPLTDNFTLKNLNCSFSVAMTECYYLHWTPINFYLEPFLQKNISAVSIALGKNIIDTQEKSEFVGKVIAEAVHKAEENTNTEIDRHFLFMTDGKSFYYLTEPILIRIVTYICLLALFVLCMSALFKRRRVLQARTTALLQIWWIIPLYFVITAIALIMGKIIVLRLSISLTGNQDIWSYAPRWGIVLQFLFSVQLLSIIQVIEQLSYFPDNPDIYGYLGNIVAFVNLIIFMSIQFSLAPFFVWLFVCSYIVYHVKTRFISVIWMIIMYLPPLVVLYSSIKVEANIFSAALSLTNIGRYALITCMLMPLELNIARIQAFTGKIGKSERFRIPIITITTTLITMIICIYLFINPLFTKNKPQPIHIGYLVNNTNANIAVVSPYMLPDMEIQANTTTYCIDSNKKESFTTIPIPFIPQQFTVSYIRKNILERSIVTITITSLNKESPPLRYEITVNNKHGTAVYDASIPHQLSESGSLCTFLPGENPPEIFSFEFSGSKNDELVVSVHGLFSVPDEFTQIKASVPVTYTEIIDSMQTFTIEPEKE